MAAVLACGPDARLSHRSAADLHGIRPDGGRRWEVVVPTRGGGRCGPSVVRLRRTSHLPACDTTTVRGIPATSIARTLVDLAGVLDERALQRAVHEAEVERVLDVAAVLAVLARLPNRRGATTLRTALGVSVPDVDNATFVAAFLRLCGDHGLPRPATNVHEDVGLVSLGELDLVYAAARVIVELDGERVHQTRRRFHEDRRRDAYLAARGWLTLRYTWPRVTGEREEVAAEVKAVLRLRSDGVGTD
jgi:hypothetical protein